MRDGLPSTETWFMGHSTWTEKETNEQVLQTSKIHRRITTAH